MTEFTVLPEKGLGPFELGSSVRTVVQYIREHNREFSKAVTKFNECEPLDMNICIDLIHQGIELRFNPFSQRLELIRIYNLFQLMLVYNDTLLSAGDHLPTFLSVHSKFGPTSAGHYSDAKDVYLLHYPGTTFVFHIPEDLRQEQKVKDGKMPTEFDSVVLTCIYLYVSDSKEPKHIHTMQTLGKPLVLSPSQGILFSDTNMTLKFGNTPQDALSVLGSPQHISYKKSNPLSIHERLHVREHASDNDFSSGASALHLSTKEDYGSPMGRNASTTTTATTHSREFQYDYFYNYFDLGLDILFDASGHYIKKFVVHTNFPTHPNFNLYQKCNFTILPPATEEEGEEEDDFDEVKLITPEMKWPEIAECYGKSLTEPFFLPASKDNPFGGSRYYAHKDIIFEVMENNHISSVTLFKL